LEAIARSSKIKVSLLAELERGDVSKWPGGIFRRGFLREYASAVGLPAEPLLAEFSRLFPEPGAPVECEAPATGLGTGLRVTLDPEACRDRSRGRRVLAAAADACIVILFGKGAALLSGLDVWLAIGAVGLAYHAVTTASLGHGLVTWLLARKTSAAGHRPALPATQGRAEPGFKWTRSLVRRSSSPDTRRLPAISK
jgi:Helix-turn-helix domain